MARIPTINAQDITPPPGTAGGVLLGKVGISDIQVTTPLTQQLNPAAFGQEGAAIAQGSNDILNNAIIPRMRREAANQRFTEYADTSAAVNREIDDMSLDIQTGNIEVNQYGQPRNIMKEIQTSTGNWLKRIETNISDPRYRGAAKISIAQKIATMNLAAANKLTTLSDQRAEAGFLRNSYDFQKRFKLPTRQSTVHGNLTTLPNWDIPLGELDTLENAMENTLQDPLKKLELRDKGRLQIFNEIVEKLKLTDPKLGMQFMESDQVAKLLDGVSIGEEVKAKAIKAFQTMVKDQWAYEKVLDEKEHKRNEEVSTKLVEANHGLLYQTFSTGTAVDADGQPLKPLWLISNWKKHYINANRKDDFEALMTFAKDSVWERGETDPKELFKVQKDIFMERANMNEAMNNIRINNQDKQSLLTSFESHRKGNWLVNNNQFKNAKESLMDLINIPASKEDKHSRQKASNALSKWMQTVDTAISKGPEWTEKNIDWMDFSNDLMTEFGSVHQRYDADQTQKYLQDIHDDLPSSLQNLSWSDAKEATIYDFERMEVQAHLLLSQGKLKGQKAQDVANALKKFRNIITPQRLEKERGQLGKRDKSTEEFKTKYFKFIQPPGSAPGALKVDRQRTPMSTMTDPKLTGPSTKKEPATPVQPLPVPSEPAPAPAEPTIAPNLLDLTAKTDEDLNEIRNIIIDLAEGKMISHLRDYADGNITNFGIAREIWETVADEIMKNPSDEELKKLFDQYNIPYKR